jgi:hypothetical protein
MSQKKILYNSSLFDYTTFCSQNFFLTVYFFKNKFYFILPINFFYFKSELYLMKQFNLFFLKTFSLHWMRVSFRGKGYRLRKFKKINKVTLNFGHSHWSRLILSNQYFFFKKIRRQNYLCFSKYYFFYKNLKINIRKFKKLNSYTKRGLRLRKQYIRRRFGKISQVVSSLH